MKTHWIKVLSAALASLMLLTSLAACADTSDEPSGDGTTASTEANGTTAGTDGSAADTTAGTKDEASAGTTDSSTADTLPGESSDSQPDTDGVTEPETDSPQSALDALGEIDFGKKEFTILYQDTFKGEVYAENKVVDADGGTAQVINDAVYARNSLLEDRCNLTLTFIERDPGSLPALVQNEASAPTGDFQLVNTYIFQNASLAVGGYLSDLNALGTDLEGEWWDSGTSDFVLKGGVYFMTGSLNYGDDNVTYVLIFNKEMQRTYSNTVPNPYDTVRASEWTLDYFNTVIQGVSADSDGNGEWNENDTYGFVTTWEYGTTFYIGSDMRYVLNDAESDMPTLFLADESRMERALNVIELSQKIYHEQHATYMSPPGEEFRGTSTFRENRALFFGDTCMYLAEFNRSMKGEYGVLPIPKYNKDQTFYRTWTHASGSSFSATSALRADDRELVGKVLTAYAILSHQHLKPAFYDTVLTSRNVHDADSVEMLDILFQNRVYDMAFYFNDLNLGELVKTSVNNNDGKFSSNYKRVSSRFDNKINSLLSKLGESDE